jgi:hypothetical protein
MKASIKFSLVAAALANLFFSNSAIASGINKDKDSLRKSEPIIEISSRLTVKGSPAAQYELFLSLDGMIVDSFVVKKSRPIHFELEQNKLYALVYKKTGFPDKIIMVDTKVSVVSKFSVLFNVDFEIELDYESSTQKKDFVDYPVAIIRYDAAEKDFVYSQKYYKEVHLK